MLHRAGRSAYAARRASESTHPYWIPLWWQRKPPRGRLGPHDKAGWPVCPPAHTEEKRRE